MTKAPPAFNRRTTFLFLAFLLPSMASAGDPDFPLCKTTTVPHAEVFGPPGNQSSGVCYAYTAADLLKYHLNRKGLPVGAGEVIPPEFIAAHSESNESSYRRSIEAVQSVKNRVNKEVHDRFAAAKNRGDDEIRSIFQSVKVPVSGSVYRKANQDQRESLEGAVEQFKEGRAYFDRLKELGPGWKSPLARYGSFAEFERGELPKFLAKVDGSQIKSEMGISPKNMMILEARGEMIDFLEEEYRKNFQSLDGGNVSESLLSMKKNGSACILKRSTYDSVNQLAFEDYHSNATDFAAGVCEGVTGTLDTASASLSNDLFAVIRALAPSIERGQEFKDEEQAKERLVGMVTNLLCEGNSRAIPGFTLGGVKSWGPLADTSGKKEPAKSAVVEQLLSGNPVGLSYSLLGVVKPGEMGAHASVAVGLNLDESASPPACEVVIRNSWGESCEDYAHPERCTKGYIRVPLKDLNLSDADWIEP